MNLKVYTSLWQCHQAMLDQLRQAVFQQQGDFHLALSGGSTPVDFFRYWLDHPQSIPLQNLHFWWVDERCVSADDSRSNFRNAQIHLLGPLGIENTHIHRMPGELAAEQAADRYGADVLSLVPCRPDGIPQFDFLMLGMGPDGHFASVFPGVVVRDIAGGVGISRSPDGLERITLTEATLCAARAGAFMVTGGGKKQLLDAIAQGDSKAKDLPAARYTQQRPDIPWFVFYGSEELHGKK